MNDCRCNDSLNARARHNCRLLERGVTVKLVGDPAAGTWTLQYPEEFVLQAEEYDLVMMTPWRYHRLLHMEKVVHTLVRELGYNAPDE